MIRTIAGFAVLVFASGLSAADLEMKIIAGKTDYVLDRGGKSAADYEKAVRAVPDNPVKPPAVDLTLRITNAGKAPATILVGGDPNVATLELKGPGTIYLAPRLATTQEFRLPRSITLAPGKSHDIPLKHLGDGHRGLGRHIYWTEPGEYTLAASYQLSSNEDGEKGPLLKAEPITLKVTLK
jgi:hypothetical protein